MFPYTVPRLLQSVYRRGVFRLPGASKPLYVTFDDGPHPHYTPQILRILDQQGIPATFFVTGEQARRYPALVRDVIAAGHGVGCHGERHVLGHTLSAAEEVANFVTGFATLQHITGTSLTLMRPPHGRIRRSTASILTQKGYDVILYEVIPYDYRTPGADVIARRVIQNVRNGSIILLHDGGGDRAHTVAALAKMAPILSRCYTWGDLQSI